MPEMREVWGNQTRKTPAVDRFFRYVEKQVDGCWLWVGAKTKKGYSVFWTGERYSGAHRWAYEHWVGPIPEGHHLDHFVCETPSCVNPQHVRPATVRENNLRSGCNSALNLAKTHCKRGHEFTEENTRINSKGQRICRACARWWAAMDRAARRLA